MDPGLARQVWRLVEPLNAVAYFSPECREEAVRLGLKGYWMGYFAFRASPLGPVPAGVVEATFYNFHPSRVRRAIPDAWSFSDINDVVEKRSEAAAVALRRHLPDSAADRLAAETLPTLQAIIDRALPAGRPLFAANRDLAWPADPVAALWHATTTLREHRGDGHVALLAGAGLDGCEVHVLLAAAEGVAPEVYERTRGWSADDWQAAVDRLAGRGLVTADGALTAAGRELRDEIERRTDELAVAPYAAMGEAGVESLQQLLTPAARPVMASGEILFPNPMGLPASE